MKIFLCVTTFGEFQVIVKDQWNNAQPVTKGYSLEQVLKEAAIQLGHPITLPIGGVETL